MTNTSVHLLIGGGGDIGRAVAQRVADRGDRVVLAGRPSQRLKAAGEAFDVEPIELDARNPDEVERAADAAIDRHGRLDSICNLVGSVLLKPAHQLGLDELDETLRLNLHSAFGAVRAAGKKMRKTGGSVVLMSSAAARLGVPNHEAIAAAKGAVLSLGLSAAATYSRYGVRVNVVAPGLVQTALTQHITENEVNVKASEALHPLGRLGGPDDVASMIAWLVAPDQTWITGQVLGVDGGLATLKAHR
jgi:NAD(P)-dependent dehydrogenase (short-subunit alcohol dehydrogenase family)